MNAHILFLLLLLSYTVCAQPGLIDPSFSTGQGADAGVNNMALQPDGKLIVGGPFTVFNGQPRMHIVRLNTNGGVDNTFNIGSGADYYVTKTVVLSGGRILVSGLFASFNGVANKNLVMLHQTGAIDNSFNIGTGPSAGGFSYVNDLLLSSDSMVYVVGQFTQFDGLPRQRIARISLNGSLDPTFDSSNGANGNIVTVIGHTDSAVVVGGEFTSYGGQVRGRIARVFSNGDLDTAFAQGAGFNNKVWCLASGGNQKLLIGGDFTSFNGASAPGILMLNSDGTVDSSFNVGSGAAGGSQVRVSSIVLQSDGKAIVAGQFNEFAGIPCSGIVRLNADGSVDETFDIHGSLINPSIARVILQPDGKALLAGQIITQNNQTYKSIVRIHSECITPPESYISQEISLLSSSVVNAQYQWIDCAMGSSVIVGATGQTFQPQVNGTYAVATVSGACLDTSECVTVFNVGVKQIEQTTVDIKIFPNPTMGTIHWTEEGEIGSRVKSIQVFNMQGGMVMEIHTNGGNSIDLSGLPTSLYTLGLLLDDQSMRIGRVAIVH